MPLIRHLSPCTVVFYYCDRAAVILLKGLLLLDFNVLSLGFTSVVLGF
ncbi:hypothetical protein COO91_06475 [Nostoc flagelliforme CCNUN1]|uniref:Uncharacterized protein n=1 Tax=Nostoc flagelliforme CCNUN1 TaxID=2038116 RepID=A0A2K8SYK3_9NOSO|nr:hypothetical protein COO91_06475 [Nostoc flagelliforme CCNUN1]